MVVGLILAQIGGCRSVVEVEIDDCGFDLGSDWWGVAMCLQASAMGFGHGSVGKNGFQMLTMCLLNKEKWKLFGIHLLKEFQGVIKENNF